MAGKGAAFSRLLASSAASINDTLSLVSEPAVAGGKDVVWKEVVAAAVQVAKHATAAGVLWTGDVTKEDGVQSIQSFTEALQGFLLLCHGSTVGAGPTLVKIVYIAAKQVVDAGLNFLRGAVAFSGREKVDLPVLVGLVWEACEAVKKIPPDNCSAIGRSLTQVAVSVKDVLRELNELKQVSASENTGELKAGQLNMTENIVTYSQAAHLDKSESDASSLDESVDFSDELSVEEMQVVQSVKEYISSFLNLLKQLLYIIADTSKGSAKTSCEETLSWWERILQLCKDIGVRVDELGASLYPPQEIDILSTRITEMESLLENLQTDVFSLKGFMPEDYRLAMVKVKSAGGALKMILDSSNSIEVRSNFTS